MEHVGQIFKQTEKQVADLYTTDKSGNTIVTITAGKEILIQFPMPAGADANEIALRSQNVINQTDLAPSQCRVDVQSVEL